MDSEINIKTVAIILALIIIPIAVLLVYNQLNKPNTKLDVLLDKPSPQFSLQDRNKNIYTNDNLKGKNVALFFSDGLACYPACWQQIAAFATDPRFNNADTVALSVVLESPEDWKKTTLKMDGIDKANIVFDKGGQISRAFGMTTVRSVMHQGRLGHTYVIIDKQGIIKYVYDDPSMAIRNDQIFAELEKN